MRRRLLTGDEAVARGAYEAGVVIATAYPGTPSTEILETIATYRGVRAEWCTNEKVAFEVALGASLTGVRALVAMKHVGVNVAADSLITASYTGVQGGLVLVSADDPGMHSSQNEQDNRWYARLAKVPMLEPADSEDARRFTREAFDLSERYQTPVLIRLTTRVCHTRTGVAPEPARRRRRRARFQRDPRRFVMVPAHARLRHVEVESRLRGLARESNRSRLNTVIRGGTHLGIVASGPALQYAREVAPEASVFAVGMSYPLPIRRLKKFAEQVEDLVVVEELDDLVATELRAAGISCRSKHPSLRTGELNPDRVQAIIEGRPSPATPAVGGRPPVLCPGCPHRHVFYVLRKLGAVVTGDIGCYTLGALPPLDAMDTCVAMGASVGVAAGLEATLPEKDRRRLVAVIGDSTFFHAGVPGLIDAVYNRRGVPVLVLDNATTAMTGLQDHPGTGRALQERPAQRVDVSALCRGLGIKQVTVVDPYDLAALEAALRRALASAEPTVVIARHPCLLVQRPKAEPLTIDPETCRRCRACLETGCPAIVASDPPSIDATLCVGCGLCVEACRFGAIGSKGSARAGGSASRAEGGHRGGTASSARRLAGSGDPVLRQDGGSSPGRHITNVLLVGVGGQGVLTAARILAEGAFASGSAVSQSEVHGMSQRGGSVECQVRFGGDVAGPLIPAGRTDVLVALDLEEGKRALSSLRAGGTVVSADEEVLSALPNPRTLNVALLGALSTVLSFPQSAWRSALSRVLAARTRSMNRQAFTAGRRLARRCLTHGRKGPREHVT